METKEEPEQLTTSERSKEEPTCRSVFVYRLIRQIFFVLTWFSLGLYSELSGPSLPVLKARVDSSWEEISRALIGRSVGFFTGSLAGGVICDRFHKHVDLVLMLVLLLASVSTAAIPWCPLMELLAFVFFLQGFAEGIINAGGNTAIFKLWGERSASPMHSLHFGYGVGAILAPQLIRPFLIPITRNVTSGYLETYGNLSNQSDIGDREIEGDSSIPSADSPIEVAHFIGAGIALVMALTFLFFYLRPPPAGFKLKNPVKNAYRSLCSPASCGQGSAVYGLTMLILLFVFFMDVAGGERVWGKFVFSFATQGTLRFTIDDGTFLNSLYWAFFTAGRGLGSVVAHWVPVRYMIVAEIAVINVTGIVLSSAGYRISEVLWACNCVLGLFHAPLFPGGMAWANLYLEMTSVATAVLLIGSATGGFVYQWITGALFDVYGPDSLVYVVLAFAVLLAVKFLVMNLVARIKGTRFGNQDSASEEGTS
ncbi:sodium-dependent glucose transporter 1A-like [Lingula anatina]|uniref:Sodium-dependent glucose transporter 1A-like n=1 Tax=Lingula anatina TaxID=7574 RepID=A0A1S3K6K3_LINAN|nr:sodium-dependent glucose transporter 1A-like [Lingula anatina]|eukprot:XP_013418265.1 sodium-dependent glucose transporter 1A-like [Lingula anatina]